MGTCNVDEILNKAVEVYVGILRKLHIYVEEPKHGIVKMPFSTKPIPSPIVKAMAVILNERLTGREVVFEGFVGDVYVKTRARIKEVVYENHEPVDTEMFIETEGFRFVLESIEPQPRTFEVHMAINGYARAVSLLNASLLVYNNGWIMDEIMNAAKEANEKLAREREVAARVLAALKLLGYK